jgi:hypothetical protein
VLVYALTFPILSAEHPGVAVGILLQTLAGLLASGRLWANSASDALIRWGAHQIKANRLGIAGLFDGSLPSLALATTWCATGFFLGGSIAWPPTDAFHWLVAIAATAILWSGVAVYMLAMAMFVGRVFVGAKPPPDGASLRTLEARLASNDWPWSLAGFAFLAGALLEISAA